MKILDSLKNAWNWLVKDLDLNDLLERASSTAWQTFVVYALGAATPAFSFVWVTGLAAALGGALLSVIKNWIAQKRKAE